jgi:hypothetical protein
MHVEHAVIISTLASHHAFEIDLGNRVLQLLFQYVVGAICR